MGITVAVLAGGRGSRIGGDKALVELAGRPLISYPLLAAQRAGLVAIVVAKRTTRLPALTVPVLLEPPDPVHPLLGIITALERHEAVLAIPCDMPFVEPAHLAALAALPADLATLFRNEPFPSLYRRAVLPQLYDALNANQSMRSTQAQCCAPAAIAATCAATQISIDTTEDLAAAEELISAR